MTAKEYLQSNPAGCNPTWINLPDPMAEIPAWQREILHQYGWVAFERQFGHKPRLIAYWIWGVRSGLPPAVYDRLKGETYDSPETAWAAAEAVVLELGLHLEVEADEPVLIGGGE